MNVPTCESSLSVPVDMANLRSDGNARNHAGAWLSGTPEWPRSLMLSILLLLSLFIACSLAGIPTVSASELEAQRLLYRAAENALKRNELKVFKAILSQLENYPLYPYLIHQELERRLNTASKAEISTFLEQYGDLPMADPLRHRWLARLAREQRWQDFLTFYQGSERTVMRCLQARALLQSGHTSEGFDAAALLWQSGTSQPTECDPVFVAWRHAGKLTTALLWERTALSLEAGQTGMVRYLRSLHVPADQKRLDAWQSLVLRPTDVSLHDWSEPAHFMAPRMLTIIFGRLIRLDVPKALEAWHTLQGRGLDRLQYPHIEQELALYLVLRRHPEALAYIENLPDALQTPQLREWRVRAALQTTDWSAVMRAYAALESDQKQFPRWRYWQARALEALGSEQQAASVYMDLAGEINFYGILAADRMGVAYDLRDASQLAAELDTGPFERLAAVQRARELRQLDRTVAARREWIRLTRNLDAQELAAAAVLAHRWQWHDRAIFAAARTEVASQFWHIRFPTPYQDLVQHYAAQYGLEPALVFAVIRQESAFVPDARSSAGALGLMQILPATGRSIARSLNEKLPHTLQLLDPERNVRFGTFYLQRRLREMDDHAVLAAAAYNAGQGRVRTWLPHQAEVASDVWIETLPFFETRDYVQRVLTYTAIYNQRLGRPPLVISTLMPAIQPRQPVLAQTEFDLPMVNAHLSLVND